MSNMNVFSVPSKHNRDIVFTMICLVMIFVIYGMWVYKLGYSSNDNRKRKFAKNKKNKKIITKNNILESNNIIHKKCPCVAESIAEEFVSNFSKEIITPYIIGISGPTASGKTVIAHAIVKTIEMLFPGSSEDIIIISQDSYYKGGDSNTNYDIPKAIDFKLLLQHLNDLKNGKCILCPIYDFSTHSRKDEVIKINPAKIIIVEGILILSQKNLLNYFDDKIYINATDASQLIRRITRDINERGRQIEEVGMQYVRDVEPSNEKYVKPSAANAKIIVNNFNGCYTGPEMILYKIVSIYSRILRSNTCKSEN